MRSPLLLALTQAWSAIDPREGAHLRLLCELLGIPPAGTVRLRGSVQHFPAPAAGSFTAPFWFLRSGALWIHWWLYEHFVVWAAVHLYLLPRRGPLGAADPGLWWNLRATDENAKSVHKPGQF